MIRFFIFAYVVLSCAKYLLNDGRFVVESTEPLSEYPKLEMPTLKNGKFMSFYHIHQKSGLKIDDGYIQGEYRYIDSAGKILKSIAARQCSAVDLTPEFYEKWKTSTVLCLDENQGQQLNSDLTIDFTLSKCSGSSSCKTMGEDDIFMVDNWVIASSKSGR